MPNEVEIKITADDLTGPGFASVLAKLALLKKAAKDVKFVPDASDSGAMTASLIQMKQKMQSLGLADFADINQTPGAITNRLLLLRRLIQQSGISDMMDVNVNDSKLQFQLTRLKEFADQNPITMMVNTDFQPFAASGDITQFKNNPWSVVSDSDLRDTAAMVFNLGALKNAAAGASLQSQHLADALAVVAAVSGGGGGGRSGNGPGGGAFFTGGGPWWAWFNWGTLARDVNLFGGAFKGLVPLLGSVSVWHILADNIAEFAAVLIPATIGTIAFGVAAAPTFQHIGVQAQNLWTTTQALGQSIYPLTAKMQSLGNAVKPEVYLLLGDALQIVNARAGEFSTVAAQAGHSLDQLAARATAAIVSGPGFGSFMKNAESDILGLGTVFGNVFGTIGNLLKTMPGYAQILLRGWEDLTGALEAFTGNHVVQDLIGIGLAAHGAILWVGLLTTGALVLGDAMVGLGQKVGIVSAETVFFNGAEFATGLRIMAVGAWDAAAGMLGLGAAEDAAAAGATILTGATAVLDAISPFAWVTLAAAALGGLVFWLERTEHSVGSLGQSMNTALGSAPLGNLSGDISADKVAITQRYATAVDQLNQAMSQSKLVFAGRAGEVRTNIGAISDATTSENQYRNELSTLNKYQGNYNALLKVAGGNTWAFAQAGITTSQVLGANAQQLKALEVQIQAVIDSFNAMQVGTGRAGAAMNALNYSGDTTSNILGSIDVDLKNVATAQGDLMSTVLGGEQAFISFNQAVNTTRTSAKAAGASLTGLNANSLTLASNFYSTLVPAAQTLVGNLEAQDINTRGLTQVVADASKQMTGFAGSNVAAKSVIVDFINNALGPGTVSLQDLNKWVGKNSTGMGQFAKDVADATINAGVLGGVLNSDVKSAFAQSALMASGFQKDLGTLQNEMEDHAPAAAIKATAQEVYNDLIHSGVSAQIAKKDVDAYFRALGMIPPNVTTNIKANTGQASLAVQRLADEIDGLQNRTVTIRTVTIGGPAPVPGAHLTPGMAHGGYVLPHAAYGGYRSGTIIAGESGAEMITLPAGSYVHTASESARMGYGGRGGGPTALVLKAVKPVGGSKIEAALFNWYMDMIQNNGGGNVQAAFGDDFV